MKKLICALLSFALGLSLAACSNWSVEIKEPEDLSTGSAEESESSQSNESSESETEDSSDREPPVSQNSDEPERLSRLYSDTYHILKAKTGEYDESTKTYATEDYRITLPPQTEIYGFDGEEAYAKISERIKLFFDSVHIRSQKNCIKGADGILDVFYNPKTAAGYISHSKVKCGDYDALLIVTGVITDKNALSEAALSYYWQHYYISLDSNLVLSVSFMVECEDDEEPGPNEFIQEILSTVSEVKNSPTLFYTAEEEPYLNDVLEFDRENFENEFDIWVHCTSGDFEQMDLTCEKIHTYSVVKALMDFGDDGLSKSDCFLVSPENVQKAARYGAGIKDFDFDGIYAPVKENGFYIAPMDTRYLNYRISDIETDGAYITCVADFYDLDDSDLSGKILWQKEFKFKMFRAEGETWYRILSSRTTFGKEY